MRDLAAARNTARKTHDLCLCGGDDERIYATQADADNDRRPSEVCGDCGKKKLRIAYFGAPKNEGERITVRKIPRVR